MRFFRLTILFVTISMSILSAQSLLGTKICIDPGHGGYDPANDRFIPQTGYWESLGNWHKAVYLKQMLTDLGAFVVVTRSGNNDADDHALSVRAGIANTNNVDLFHSIHSNGFQGTANYSLMLFRGTDTAPIFPLAKVYGQTVGNKIFAVLRTTALHNRGDWSFYGNTSGLGVLRPLNMQGVLSEGSFHDYIPESWRLMNLHYLKHESWAITRALLDHFSGGNLSHGAIAGLVRDPLKTVTYYSFGGNESKLPLNNIKVTVQPGNIVYNGDDKNNGFFLIDNLVPGQYKVIFEKEGYAKDSSTVNVIAHQTVFADKFMNFDTTKAPIVESFYPGPSIDSVKTSDVIRMTFSRPMKRETVESAFQLSPPAPGVFTWTADNLSFTYKPNLPYLPGHLYTVTLLTQASSIWNVGISSNFSFTFNTKFRARLNLTKSYPAQNASDLSTTLQIRLNFDAPIFQGSLAGNVRLIDGAGVSQTVANVKVTAVDGRGFVFFEPRDPLLPSAFYTIVLHGKIMDLDSIPLVDTLRINFYTSTEVYQSGNIIDNFETMGGWRNPNVSSSSVGIDTVISKFIITTEKKVTGLNSGKIVYQFTGANGVTAIPNLTKPSIGQSANSQVGVWVFGDQSNNLLEYNFNNNVNNIAVVKVDTINWTGWKLKRLTIGSIPLSGEKFLSELVVKQTASGLTGGTIYFDDFQNNILVPVNENQVEVPVEFSLIQNYPNPFNPSTVISYQLAGAGHVTLKIYDLLGREVTSLVDEEKPAGSYTVNFDAGKLSTGVYFYELKSGTYRAVKKLMLMK